MMRASALALRAVFRARSVGFVFATHLMIALVPASAVADEPPEFFSFSAVRITDDWWMFYGEFDDESPKHCVIEFGGILDGESVHADYDGTFSYVTELSPTTYGVVSAVVVDKLDQASDELEDYVAP